MHAIPFTKMHGLGNDYVYVDCIANGLPLDRAAELSRRMSDRHRGIGSDGLILIAPVQANVQADVRMIMFNADGSRGEMCGNGIRCVAKYAVEHGHVNAAPTTTADGCTVRDVRIETDNGVLIAQANLQGDVVNSVRVDMGAPILEPGRIPVAVEGNRCVRHALELPDMSLQMTCVSMGNPHAVFFCDNARSIDLKAVGPRVEKHPAFPNRVNAHFVTVQNDHEATMFTWERGSGATQACGTGACAVLVAAVLEERMQRTAKLHLPGGDLMIEWPDAGNVFMTGPAEMVFEGVWKE